jgi:uncharacterized protein (DUF58 family)
VYAGTIPARQGGAGVEFFDVREHQMGDSPRWINWRASARHPFAIYSNTYEQERVVDVGIILDGRRRMNEFGQRSLFEHSVMATAALADALLSSGNRLSLLFLGDQLHWTMPGYGKIQVERILQDISRLKVGDSQVFDELHVPRRFFSPRSQVIVVSPLCLGDYAALADLRARRHSLLVVSPDPVKFELMDLPDTEAYALAGRIARLQRNLLLTRLRAIGIHVVDWDISQPFEQVARRELERRPVVVRGAMS